MCSKVNEETQKNGSYFSWIKDVAVDVYEKTPILMKYFVCTAIFAKPMLFLTTSVDSHSTRYKLMMTSLGSISYCVGSYQTIYDKIDRIRNRKCDAQDNRDIVRFLVSMAFVWIFPHYLVYFSKKHKNSKNTKNQSDTENNDDSRILTTESMQNDDEKNTTNICDIIRNPYVILIGLSTFDQQNVLAKLKCHVDNLTGVKNDITKLEQLFAKRFGDDNVKSICGDLDKKSIDKFLNTCFVNIADHNKDSKQDSIDALILYFSGHGFENNYAIDSKGKIFSLFEFKYKFREKILTALKGRPQLYFHDCCRNLKFPIQDAEMKSNDFELSSWKDKGYRMTLIHPYRSKCNLQNVLTFNATADAQSVNEDKEYGSKMAKAMIECFENLDTNQTLGQLLYCLKQKIQSNMEDNHLQTPEVCNFLPRDYYIANIDKNL